MKIYKSREDAGRHLTRALAKRGLRGGAVILAIPLGGPLVAAPIAAELGLPLEALIVRKLRCTTDHALAAGALAETGAYFVNPDLPGAERLDARHLREQLEFTRRAIADEERALRGGRPLPDLRGRAVILVDDGATTGATLRAAAKAARERGASSVIAAVPVGPPELPELVAGYADDLVQLHAPEAFSRIAHYYEDWSRPAVSDVVAALGGGMAWPARG